MNIEGIDNVQQITPHNENVLCEWLGYMTIKEKLVLGGYLIF